LHKLMMRIIAMSLMVVWLPIGTVLAMPQIMTTAELQPGMVGVARTVMKGSDIVTFDVEILGVEANGKGAHEQILAKASGPIVDQTGGVIHGMSGSPVYVDGRLVGAVARGIAAETDPHVFYITPIEDMLQIWNMPDAKKQGNLKQVDLKADLTQNAPVRGDADLKAKPEKEAAAIKPNKKDKKDKAGKKTFVSEPVQAAPAISEAKPAAGQKAAYAVSSPLLVSGFSDASLNFLREGLAPFSLVPYEGAVVGSSAAKIQRDATLEPGNSVAAALVFGDFTVGATGTVTAVDGSRIVAFGHPYTYRGNVNYFMMDANVIGSAGSLTNGTKIATFGNVIGRINQDRYSGIAGTLGTFPSVVPIEVVVSDAQTGKKVSYSSSIAYDEDLLPTISSAIAYASIDKTIDRQGDGSAAVDFEITTNAVGDGKLKRSNMYYNAADVGPLAVSELGQALNLICSNDETESDVLGIKINIAIDETRQTASLIEAVPDKTKVMPGDTVHLKVKLKPYRRAVETVDVPYAVSKNQIAGPLNLELRGGGLIPVTQLLQQQGLVMGAELEGRQPQSEKIKGFLAANKNNEIIIAPAAMPLLTEKEQMQALQQVLEQPQPDANAKPVPEQDISTHFATKYIIDNLTHVSLQVEKKK
jgi:hypothetical protein